VSPGPRKRRRSKDKGAFRQGVEFALVISCLSLRTFSSFSTFDLTRHSALRLAGNFS